MKIAVTGKSGQVVTSLVERGFAAGHEIILIGRPELDLAEPHLATAALEAVSPDVVISAAAYTAVDRAETESALAHAINGRGAGLIAHVARSLGVPMVHLSTDYVFDGACKRPYTEADLTAPTGVYGASKLAGEAAVMAAYHGNSAILRVAWLYSPFGANFVKTMLRLAARGDEIAVVCDQVGNPTSALDVADGILRVAENLVAGTDPALRGVFHMTATGEASWAQFAEAIFAASGARNGPTARVKRIPTAQYPTPATRPANSRLDSGRIARIHGVVLPHWQKSLEAVVACLLA